MSPDASETAVIQAVLLAEEQRRQALLSGNDTALSELLADDLVYVHSTAACDSKASYLAKLQSGTLRYLSLHWDGLQARVIGQCVVVTGRMSAEISKEGQSKSVRSLFMTVWSEHHGADGPARWKLRAHQGTPQSF